MLITRGFGVVSSVIGVSTGTISLEASEWQNIAIPVEGVRVKEYFLDQLLAQVQVQTPGAVLSDVVEIAKAFPSNGEFSGLTLSFVPGVTNALADGNFYLVTDDGGSKEINGFLVRIRDISSIFTGVLTFDWDVNDGVGV